MTKGNYSIILLKLSTGLIIVLLSLYFLMPQPSLSLTKSISLGAYSQFDLKSNKITESKAISINKEQFSLTKEEVKFSNNKRVSSFAFQKKIQKPIELDTSFSLVFKANGYSCITTLTFHSNSYNEFGLNINYSPLKSEDDNSSFYLDFTKLVIPHYTIANNKNLPYFLYYTSLFNPFGNGCYKIKGVIKFYMNGSFSLAQSTVEDMSLYTNSNELSTLIQLY